MSKWANRLKGVLTENVISEQCLDSPLTITDKSQQKGLLSVIVSGQPRDCSKNIGFKNAESFFLKTEQCLNSALTITDKTKTNTSLFERLNAMIGAGVSFEVSADDFQTFGASERENVFLQANKPAILCILHQSLLMKYLALSDLQMFKDEVTERAAIIFDGANTEPPFEIVAEISREWFADLLEKIAERNL